MFSLTRTDPYTRKVRDLVTTTFNLSGRDIQEHAEVWKNWLDLGEQKCNLHELIKSDVKDAFKARAITILLAPDIKLVPFVWREKDVKNYLFIESIKLADLSPKLQDFTVKLLELGIDSISPEDAHEDARNALFFYGKLILQALVVLKEDDPRAAWLADRYEINDPIPYENIDSSSGYEPFRSILSADVPEKWKRLADKKIRNIICAEQEDRIQPRGDWEEALGRYASHIQIGFYGEKFPYSAELFASQVSFILHLPRITGRALFPMYHAGKILKMLAGDAYKYIRHRFARYMILADHGNHGAYRVYDEETMTGALMMFDEFGGGDSELCSRLKPIITEGQREIQERQTSARATNARVNEVLSRMR